MADQLNNFLNKMEELNTQNKIEQPEINLAEMNCLVKRKLALETDISTKEEELNLLKKELTNLNRKKIPEAMLSLGLSKVTTESGAELTISKQYRGNISEKTAEFAMNWFIRTNQADSIKNAYTVTLGVGNADEAKNLEEILSEAGYFYKNKKDIAWSTLASILRELDTNDELANNETWTKLQEEGKVPRNMTLKEALGAYDYYETKMKFKRNKSSCT